MRKLILLALIMATAISCGPSKTVIGSYKVMKGYWVLDQVTHDGQGKYNITLLNDASSTCFEGSTWRFIPNNNTGVYGIEGPGCASGDRNFMFTIQEIDKATGLYDFMLKPTNAKKKSETNAGFRLRLSRLDENSMQWQQTVRVDGETLTINMNFSKID